MISCSCCATSVSQFSVCGHCCAEEVERRCSCFNMNEIVHIGFEGSGKFSASGDISDISSQAGHGDGENVNVLDCYKQTPVPSCSLDQDYTIFSKEITICQEFNQSLDLDGKAQKCLSKSKTFPLSKENFACTLTQSQDSVASEDFACARSVSLPPSSTLLSAMKGGRSQNGAMVKSKLCVKWAPGVYDPPATTMSHTVKDRQQRPKAKKKDKKKHKSKSVRGSAAERKQGNHKSSNKMAGPLNLRFQASGNKQIPNDFGKCNVVDILEYDVNSQDAKCSGGFMWETLPKVHLPIGEAS